MYVNLDNLFTIDPKLLPLLLVLKHVPKIDVSDKLAMVVPDDQVLGDMVEKGYVKYVKGKKGQSELERLRLGVKGTAYLNSLEEPMVEDQDIKIFDWLSEKYKKMDKQIGNGKKTKIYIASFREKSGIEGNHLAILCQAFISDESEQEYSFKLQNVFWKPDNVYQTRFVLEDSRLYKYYLKNKGFFDQKFKEVKAWS